MDTGFLQAALHHLRDGSLSDADLLGRFVRQRDEAAFAELVHRHGSLVLGVCRRILGDAHAGEDAFQATFLLLARRAPGLTRAGSLAGWLHAAAVRLAREARRAEQRRRRRERAHAVPVATSADDMTWRELRQQLDAELARLPEHLSAPLVLCYLEGLSRAEAARRLGCSATVLRGRLERGRCALRRRLARLGLPLAAALLLVPAPDPVSAALCATTLAAVRDGLAGGPVAARIAGLTAAVSGLSGAAPWKATVAVALLAVTVGLGGILAGRPVEDPPPAAPRAAPPASSAAADAPKARTDLVGDPLPPDALLRLGTLRHRYLFHPFLGSNQRLADGKTALTSTPNEVRWVDMTTGRLMESWPLPKGLSVCGFSPDGQRALLCDGKVLRLWDLTARKELRQFQGKGELGKQVEVAFAPDGRVVATNSGVNYNSGLVRAWDVATGRQLWQEGVMGFWEQGLTLLGFLDDDKTLVVIDRATYRVSLRDRATGRERCSFATMSRNDVRMTRLAPDGKTVLMGNAGTAVRVWDLATGKELRPLDGHTDQAHRVAVSRNGKTVLTGGADPFVLVWDWPAGKRRGRIELGAGRSVDHLAVSADGKRAEIICWGERALRFFDLTSGKELPTPVEGHRGPVQGVTITPDGKVVSAGQDNTIRVWDLRTGRPLNEHATEHPVGAMTLAVSADGRLVATADINRGTVALHERDTGRLVRTIDSGRPSMSRITFGPEGRLLALTGSTAGPGVGGGRFFLALWDADRGRELRRLERATPYGAPVFSPDGRLLAEFDREQVHLLEASTGRERAALVQKHVQDLAFSPEGQTLACGDWDGITLWELATRRERARIEALPGLTRVLRFSPDGRWLAWGGGSSGDAESEAVHLWDVWRGETVRPLMGHDQSVAGLAFAPDGRSLASCSWDTTLLIWDFAGVAARQAQPAHRPDAAALAAAWNDLAGADATAAYQAVRLLAGAPAQSVPLLRERLRPTPPADKKQVERWLAGLDSDNFAERVEATRRLGRQGDRVEGALRRLLAGNPSAEARRRAEEVLAVIEGPVSDAERLRQIRGMEVLERVGKGEARELLNALAEGDPETGLTRDAAAALRRLGRRP
jgi:RNA polymerase sigma factor (sigma-70 family)